MSKKHLFEKKAIIIRRLSRTEINAFKNINYKKAALTEALAMVKKEEQELWKIIKQDYKLTPTECSSQLSVNHKTRHLLAEVTVN